MQTYERRNHKLGKIITILVMVFSIIMISLFGYLYYMDIQNRPLITYPQYSVSTRDWTSGNVIVEVTSDNSKISEYSFDGGVNFQEDSKYEVLSNGNFNIVVKDINGRPSKVVPVAVRNIDKDQPQINFENPTTVQLGSNFSVRTGVVVTDGTGSGLSNNYVTVPDKIDTSVEGEYNVVYTVFDKAGNYTEKSRTIVVTDIKGRTYYRYRTATVENYQCEPYSCNCVVSESASLNQTCPSGYTFNEPNKCCETCYKTCKQTNWSEWSSWSQTKVTPSATVEVETKIE